jgi:hypothetical protein
MRLLAAQQGTSGSANQVVLDSKGTVPLRRKITRAPRPRHPPREHGRTRRLRVRAPHRYHPVVSILSFVVLLVVLTAVLEPLAKGIAKRIGNTPSDAEELKRLRTLMEDADMRLQDAERRLREAEERLDFQEKLLSGDKGMS